MQWRQPTSSARPSPEAAASTGPRRTPGMVAGSKCARQRRQRYGILGPRLQLGACAVLAPLLLLALPSIGASQGDSGAGLGDLALDWARGRYATPLVCLIDDEPVRGMRRLMIAPVSELRGRAANRIIFVDLEPGSATRCFNDFGKPEPNIIGSLEIYYVGSDHPESARRDFKEALRRKRGFEFAIASGHLRLQKVAQPPGPSETVDFARGRAALRLIAPGSDEERLLADFRSPRKALLELRTHDGRQLAFPLFLTDLR